jgi:cysteine synthase
MKGAPTQIIDGETVYENTTGNAALATAELACFDGNDYQFIGTIHEPVSAAILACIFTD